MHPQTARAVQSWIFCLLALGTLVCPASLRADDDAVLFTPAGFSRAGQATLKPPANAGKLNVTVRDARTGAATFCRVNVVGSDGNFYYPKQNYLTPYALAGRWPKTGLGNREGKAPIRYLGRFFYSWGDFEIDLPPGTARVEVWKGLEYRPEVASTTIGTGQGKSLEIKLTNETGLVARRLRSRRFAPALSPANRCRRPGDSRPDGGGGHPLRQHPGVQRAGRALRGDHGDAGRAAVSRFGSRVANGRGAIFTSFPARSIAALTAISICISARTWCWATSG